MANVKISELNPAAALDGTELVELSQLSGGVYGSVRSNTAALAYAAPKYGIAFDASNQTFAANTATAVEFDTPGLLQGVTVSNTSRVNFPSAGVYEVTARLQFRNADNADHDARVWFRLSGTDIVNSGSVVTVPKAADGGAATLSITGLTPVTTGQYIEIIIAVEDADVSLGYTAASTSPFVAPAVPSAIITVDRIAL
jgi:hypothetical protein